MPGSDLGNGALGWGARGGGGWCSIITNWDFE